MDQNGSTLIKSDLSEVRLDKIRSNWTIQLYYRREPLLLPVLITELLTLVERKSKQTLLPYFYRFRCHYLLITYLTLASKKRSNQKSSVKKKSSNKVPLFFWFGLFLEARAEILTKILLVFWSIWRHQKDISKLTDL